ncbi:helix-turn-helix transcriptional regulator [Rhizobium ruizarguesonis]
MLKKMLKPSEVIAELKVSPRTLDRWLAKSNFPEPIRIGRAHRWYERDVQAYLEARKGGPLK